MFTAEHMAAMADLRDQEKRDQFLIWMEGAAARMLLAALGGDRARVLPALEVIYGAGFDAGGSTMLMHVLTVVVNQREPVTVPKGRKVG